MTKKTTYENTLASRMSKSDIKNLAEWAVESPDNRDKLWQWAHSQDRRTAVNALWAMSHLPGKESRLLVSLRNDFIDMLLAEEDLSKRRILLSILRKQQFDPNEIRTDFLDFCLDKINSECEPYAIRAFCIYLSFKLCRNYPELIAELHQRLTMLKYQHLQPGLNCALHKTLAGIKSISE